MLKGSEKITFQSELGRFLCASFFFDSILAFQAIVDVLRPQGHGVGRVLFGMSSSTVREVTTAKIRVSTGAVRIIAD